MENKNFKDLKIYQRACVFRKKIFELTKTFPIDEKYKLTDQIIRSTRKCPANIAEGYGRFHFKENIQYCRIARASLTETQDHLSCAFECNYISNDLLTEYDLEIETLIRMINGYIKYLNSKLKQD